MAGDDTVITNTTSISPLPKSPFLALQNPHWNNAMHDEYNALVKNGTWILVPRPAGIKLVRSIWLVKHKFHVDGTLSRYKDRLVANGRIVWLPMVAVNNLQVVTSLHNEFDMTNLGALNYFLGISATRHSTALFLFQKQYAIERLAHAHMTNCNPSRTPVDTNAKLGPKGVPVQDPTLYRSLAVGLQYLTFTRPNIPMQFNRFASTFMTLVNLISFPLSVYYTTFEELWILDFTCTLLLPSYLLGTQIRIRQAAPQKVLAEYRGVANVVVETAWLRNLLRELHSLLSNATLVYCNNVSATYLSANPVQHQQTKHIETDIHFVRDLVTAGQVRVLLVPFEFSLYPPTINHMFNFVEEVIDFRVAETYTEITLYMDNYILDVVLIKKGSRENIIVKVRRLPVESCEVFLSSVSRVVDVIEGAAFNEDERLARAINGLCDGLTTAIEEREKAINEDERLARAINGLCDGLTTAIEERETYILPPSQHRAFVSVDTNDILMNNEFPILDVGRKIISKDNVKRGFNVSSFMSEAILKGFKMAFDVVWSKLLVTDF
nr:hypothetical protein [Tanacetum cinerariifolium]